MADPQKLKRFHIEQDDDVFLIRLEDDDGGSFAVTATHDQIDLILDSLDDALDEDEEAESLDEDDEDGDDKDGPKS